MRSISGAGLVPIGTGGAPRAEDFFAANPDEGDPRSRSDLTPAMPPHLDTPYHAASQSETLFREPIAVTVDRLGRLYVTESRRHRFQVYQRA